MAGTDPALHAAAADDTVTGTGHAAVEVHAVDTDRGVILDTKIDVLADTEAEVASLAEVALAELVLLDLEATLKNLLGLLTFPPCQFLAPSTLQPLPKESILPWGHGW